MGIKQLYNDNLRKLPNEYGDVSVMEYSHFCLYNSCDFGHHHDQRFQVMPVSYLFSNTLDIIKDTDNYEVLKKVFLENYKTKK